MDEHPQRPQQAHSIWKRPYVWIAGVVALVAMVSGFAYASPSSSALRPIAVVTEYRTAEPSDDSREAAELASERRRLNRIKDSLDARERRLNRVRDRLAGRKAALDGGAAGNSTAQRRSVESE